jgi:type I restriction enzyme M protein
MSSSFDIRNSAFEFCPGPPKGNACFAWLQRFIHHLAPNGMASRVKVRVTNSELQSPVRCHLKFAIGTRSRPVQSGEGDPTQRDRALIEADLLDPMVALSRQLYYSTQISLI